MRICIFLLVVLLSFKPIDSNLVKEIFDEYIECVEARNCGIKFLCEFDNLWSVRKDDVYIPVSVKNKLKYNLPLQYEILSDYVTFDEELDNVDTINETKLNTLQKIKINEDLNTIIVDHESVKYFYIHLNSREQIDDLKVRLYLNDDIVQTARYVHETDSGQFNCNAKQQCQYAGILCKKYKTDFFCNTYNNKGCDSYAAVTEQANECFSHCLNAYFPDFFLSGEEADAEAMLTCSMGGSVDKTGVNSEATTTIDDSSTPIDTTVIILIVFVVLLILLCIGGFLYLRYWRQQKYMEANLNTEVISGKIELE